MSLQISKGIYVVGGGRTAMFFNKAKNPGSHTSSKVTFTDSMVDGRWLPWGENNMYPQEFAAKLKKTGVAIGGLDVLTSSHFGTGFSIFQAVETETIINFRERSVTSFPAIAAFFMNCHFNIFNSEIIEDYETFRIAFPEYLLSPNGQEIISVRRLKAADCRFEKPDEKTGIIWNVGVNTDWENYKPENTTVVPCFSANVPIAEIKEYCRQEGIMKFTIPVIDTLLVEKVYPAVGWHASFKNGWVDVVLAIPAFKKAMFDQQLNVKYLIHIADDYFAHMYKGLWNDFTPEEKLKKREELVDLIDSKMKGNDAAGRSLISPFFRDDTGELIKGIQIEELPQSQANGDFLTDSSAANYEILVAMGLDPAVVTGGTFGGKALSGSGSDKREAWTILCAKLPKKQIRTLHIFEIIKYWNAWPADLFGKFPNVNLTTLDNNKDGQEKVVN